MTTFTRIDSFCQTWSPRLLSVLRIVTAFLYMAHGTSKLLSFPTPFPKPVALTSLMGLAGTLELVGGALLLLGLFTRPVAFILSGEMAFAYFMGHMFKGETPVFLPLLNGGTAAILFCFACLYLATAGGGPIGADAMMRKKA
jgi:putative oxidoreductase